MYCQRSILLLFGFLYEPALGDGGSDSGLWAVLDPSLSPQFTWKNEAGVRGSNPIVWTGVNATGWNGIDPH